MARQNILIWLPSPMGDAILSTPALKAIRNQYPNDAICFYANRIVRSVLSPTNLADFWIEQTASDPFTTAAEFKKHQFERAILFKNSFMSAMTVFLANIPVRIGYAREGRGLLLTEKVYPPRLPNGKFKPASMVDYYLALAAKIGADISDKMPELQVSAADMKSMQEKLPEPLLTDGPLIILVPGGAFGANKCWPAERFAQTADFLVEKYEATVILSVAPNAFERQIGNKICQKSKHRLFNLADTPLSLGELKALYSKADLVIANDTGPRHIAIALKRKVITLFGPNDPAWTQTGYPDEIQIIADAQCAPCQKPDCPFEKVLCMHSIEVENVCNAAQTFLAKRQSQKI